MVPYSLLFAESMYIYILYSVVLFWTFKIKGLMLHSVMALTLLGAGLSMQPDAFLPCSLKILFSSSVPEQQIIKVHV